MAPVQELILILGELYGSTSEISWPIDNCADINNEDIQIKDEIPESEPEVDVVMAEEEEIVAQAAQEDTKEAGAERGGKKRKKPKQKPKPKPKRRKRMRFSAKLDWALESDEE